MMRLGCEGEEVAVKMCSEEQKEGCDEGNANEEEEKVLFRGRDRTVTTLSS